MLLYHILLVVVAFGGFVFVHELGHFLACKKVGIRVEVFSLGFGPYLLSFRRGETLYALSLIPLGGYVKMAGENALGGVTSAARPFEWGAKRPLQRAQVAIAGVLMNAIAGYFAYTCAFTIGIKEAPPIAYYVEPNGPAEAAGMTPGSRILAVNGRPVFLFSDILLRVAAAGPGETVFDILTVAGERKRVSMPAAFREGLPDLDFSPDVPVRIGADLAGGVSVTRVEPASPAEQAGLAAGDVVLEFAGRPIGSAADLIQAIRRCGESEAPLKVRRGEREELLSVTPARASPQAPPRIGAHLEGRMEWMVAAVHAGSAAAAAGIQPGDTLRLLKLRSDPSAPPPGRVTLGFEIERGGRKRRVQVTSQDAETRGAIIGHEPRLAAIRVPFPYSLLHAWRSTTDASKAIVRFVGRLFAREVGIAGVAGPVGVLSVTFEASLMGIGRLLGIFGFISINLALVNLFPLPPLDGGTLLFLAYEAVRRKPAPRRGIEAAQMIGVLLLLALLLVVTVKDIYFLLR